ncbi:unnamed protein product [Schistosoma margrebowiei]|uniref:Uncharacterized protein n=1 Tax=Schistosoma margrebowiei TaxID=48269 RepID=A0A183MNF5_9TREM|nr:unnamed protein product [Schistosoma margrebowiei]
MVVGNEQGTVDLGCVLLGTHQQGVPVILRELMLPDRFTLVSSSFRFRVFTDICNTKHDNSNTYITKMLTLIQYSIIHEINYLASNFNIIDLINALKF